MESLNIQYQNGLLTLKTIGATPAQEAYATEYLNQVNRYKIIGFYRGSPVYSLYQPPLATPAGERSLSLRLKRKFDHVRLPASATIAVNRACQCECDHCSAVYYNHASWQDLSTDQLKEALKQTVALGVTTLILLGGEPLLRRDLFEVLASIPSDQTSVILFTNGEFLSATTCQRLAQAHVMGAFVSIDHPQATIHDAFRKRQGLFDKALSGLSHLREAGLIAGISSHLSPERLKEGLFEQMMDLAKKAGAHEVTFFDAIPSGRWLKNEEGLLTDDNRKQIVQLVKKYRSLPDYPGLSVQSTMTSPKGSAFCFAANTQFYLTAAGDMCPCDFTPLTIGRFPQQSIQELWNQMITTHPYDCRAKSCRMQDPHFRKEFIYTIPDNGPFPYPLQKNGH